MKQYILKKEWNELNKKAKIKLIKHTETKETIKYNTIEGILEFNNKYATFSIGDLIEFLKDDLVDIEFHKYECTVILHIGEGVTKGFTAKEPINALFKATKFKLTNK